VSAIREVLWAYRDRLVDLKRNSRLVHGLIFKNKGAAAGASLDHSHSQLIVNPIVPVTIRDELYGAERAAILHDNIGSLLGSYRQTLASNQRRLLERYRYVDVARKVVGVGSVGTRAWVLLLVGRDNDDPLILQANEAQASVLEPCLGKSSHANHGQRVVEGQRLMQAASDPLLGWIRNTLTIEGVERDYYIRQLWDQKGSALVEVMKPNALDSYASLCGNLLARGHARSGDAVAIASYLGTGDAFDRAMAAFAEAYADQNELDYAALKEAAARGRVTAQTGV
jgi:hypothetical protein